MTAQALEILGELPELSPWCFPSPKDSRKPLVSVYRAWDRARQKAELPELRIHDTRHNVGTSLTSEGVPLPLVAAALGHRSLASTARYAHATTKAAHEAVDKLSRRFAAARKVKRGKVLPMVKDDRPPPPDGASSDGARCGAP